MSIFNLITDIGLTDDEVAKFAEDFGNTLIVDSKTP